MMKNKVIKLAAILLTVVMLGSILPAAAFADDTRTKVGSVSVSWSSPSMADGDYTPNGSQLTANFAIATPTGAVYYAPSWNISLEKYMSGWVPYTDVFVTPGNYRVCAVLVIDGADGLNYVFDNPVSFTWDTNSGSAVPTVSASESTVTVYSPQIQVVSDPSIVYYTVNFVPNGGNCGVKTLTTDKNGQLAYLPTPTRTGYDFNGWFNDAGQKVDSTTVYTAYTTLTARWTAQHVHKGVFHKGFAASCTQEGEKDYYTCSCGNNYEDSACTKPIADINTWKVIPALPHDWVSTYLVKYSDANKHYLVCKNCSAKDSGAAHIPGPPATAATDQTCTVCGYVLNSLHTHNPVLNKGFAPSCSADGQKDYYSCPDCGKFFEDAACTIEITDINTWKRIPPAAHTWGAWTANGRYNHKHVCSVCGIIATEAHYFGNDYICDICAYDASPLEIKDGHDPVMYKDNEKNVKITLNGDVREFLGVALNEVVIDCKWYDVSGSTVVVIDKEYFKTLNPGRYTIDILFNYGYASTSLTIKTGSPETGDDSNAALWTCAMLISFTGMAACVGFARKKRASE